ncbi:MAG: NINE protein [Bacteroidota bacterium]
MGYQKSRNTLILFTLFTGWIGGHRYHLKQYTLGVLYTLFFWTYIPLVISIVDLIIILRSDRKHFFKTYYRPEVRKNVNHFQEKNYDDYPYSYSLTLSNLIASLHFTPENLYVYKWLRVPGQPVKEGELICQIVVQEPDTGRHLLWKLASPKEGILQYFVQNSSRITHDDVLGFILYKPVAETKLLGSGKTSLPSQEITMDLEDERAEENARKLHPILVAVGNSIEQDIIRPVRGLPIWSIPQIGNWFPKTAPPFDAPSSSKPSSPMAFSKAELVEAGSEGSF